MIFCVAAEMFGFGGAFLMASGRAGAVPTGVLEVIPAGPTIVAFDPADVKRGSWFVIA